MNILEIKPLTSERVSQAVALDRICWEGLWTAEGYLREVNSPNSSLLTLNLWDSKSKNPNDTMMIGIACLWSIVEEAHITLLGIHPDRRRQGLGQLLLLTLLEDAIARKLEWATLEVNVNNISAINLYQKFGFEVAGIRKGYYQATGEDASVLWLKGLQHPNFKLSLAKWQKNVENILHNNCYSRHTS